MRTIRLPRDPLARSAGRASDHHDLSAHAALRLPPEPLGILLISGTHERAHYAFVLAAGAAAVGRQGGPVRDQPGLPGAAGGLVLARRRGGGCGCARAGRGRAGELREAAIELGVRLLACDFGLLMAGLDAGGLIAEAEVAGVPSFLAEVGGGQIVTL